MAAADLGAYAASGDGAGRAGYRADQPDPVAGDAPFNSIIAALEDEPPDIYPHWSVMEFEGREFDDTEGWAWGFVQGVDLCRTDWQPLRGKDQGRAWYRPIGLLGEDDFGPEQDALTHMPAQRAELASQIPRPSWVCTPTGFLCAWPFTNER